MATFHHYDSKGGYLGKSTDEAPEIPGCGCILGICIFLFFCLAPGFTKDPFWSAFWIILGLTILATIIIYGIVTVIKEVIAENKEKNKSE